MPFYKLTPPREYWDPRKKTEENTRIPESEPSGSTLLLASRSALVPVVPKTWEAEDPGQFLVQVLISRGVK